VSTLPEDTRRELESLLAALCDESMTDTQFARLHEMLESDAEARRYYRHYIDLHFELADDAAPIESGANQDAASIPVARLAPANSTDTITTRSALGGRGAGMLLRYAAAAVLLLAVGLAVVLTSRHQNAVPETAGDGSPGGASRAVLLDGGRAVWANGSATAADSSFDGTELPSETLQLASGMAEIAMGRGAMVTMIGETHLRITGDNTCQLDLGTLLVRVPPNAVGFTVTTPRARVVDHGTVFGVTVDAYGRTEVHVFEGLVETTGLRPGAMPVQLKANQALRVDDALSQPVAIAEERFATLGRWVPKHVALIDRPRDSKGLGNIFALADGFDAPGEVDRWAFFDNNGKGLKVTPLILRPTGGNAWQVIAIGATRVSDGSGVQRYDFDAVEGGAAFEPGDVFGWKAGADGEDNAGVINRLMGDGQTPVLFFGPDHTELKLGLRIEPIKREPTSYSIQVRIRTEPGDN